MILYINRHGERLRLGDGSNPTWYIHRMCVYIEGRGGRRTAGTEREHESLSAKQSQPALVKGTLRSGKPI